MSSESCSSSFHLFIFLYFCLFVIKKGDITKAEKSPELSYLRLRRQDPILFCFPKNGQFAGEPKAGPYLRVGILVCTRVPMTAVRRQ